MPETSQQSAPAAPPDHGPPASRLGWLALVPFGLFAAALSRVVGREPPLAVSLPWAPSLGVGLDFLLDGLALQLVLLITGVGALVMVYAAGYMAGVAQRGRLFALLFVFMVAMLGCVTSDDLLVLFVFWEITSLTSFLLVGFKHEYESSRRSAQQALMVTAGGGLVLLAGVLLVGDIAGTYRISALLDAAPEWRDDPRVSLAAVLVIVGAFTKSAQLPFHFWLPNAMAAPTPVSAYLHSATMVKLGVYLLARLDRAFDEVLLWEEILVTVGAATSAWAMLLTLRERDLKRIFAWSTVSALGTLVVLVGLPGAGAAAALGAFLLAHALYKAPLFFVAGNVDHCTGSRDIGKLRGLARRMPWTAAAAALAAASMAAMPFSLGFVAKDLITLARAEGQVVRWVSYSSVLVSAISVAVAFVAAVRVFWMRRGAVIPPEIHEAGWAMRIPPLVIAALGSTLGLLPWIANPLVAGTVEAVAPGADFEGLMSPDDPFQALAAVAVVLVLGFAVFVFWDRLHAVADRLFGMLQPVSWLAWYERVLAVIPRLAGAATRVVQTGKLTHATAMVVVFVAGAVGAALALGGAPELPRMELPSLAVAGACAALITAAIAACVARDLFVMLLVSGYVGLGSALLFLFLSAPDLALTQFTVEVAFVAVIASILLRVRRLDLRPVEDPPALPRAIIAIATGAVLTIVLLVATAGPQDPSLPEFFSRASVPEAHGRNVVNVILVDFRAADTVGEITVLAIALLASLPVLALLRARRGAPRGGSA